MAGRGRILFQSHLAVDAGSAEEGGAAVLAAVAVGDSHAAPGPALQQAHGQAGEEARQEQVETPRRADPVVRVKGVSWLLSKTFLTGTSIALQKGHVSFESIAN